MQDLLDRRSALKLLAAAVAAPAAGIAATSDPTGIAAATDRTVATAVPASGMTTRRVAKTDEPIPVVGLGTSDTFDLDASPQARAPLRTVLEAFAAGGASVVDTSPMYGRAEGVLGDLAGATGLRDRLWLATKVWTRGREAGIAQIEQSYARLRTQRLDLLQIHNLLDWQEHLPTLRALQADGRVRYTGITHYRADAHAELERVLAAERFDWLQVNYSLAEPEAADRLLPWCRDHGVAVLANRPFADGALFARVQGRPLPPWAAELGCASWAQFFLRFALSHPAVTCVIPATSKPRHVADNLAAGRAPLPDASQGRRMLQYWRSL
jgi:diketogulonate reductase-like aldo/keto reductase